jgi:hypothetical protein
MKDGVSKAELEQEVQALAVAYCEAIHFSKADVFEIMCHDKFFMTAVSASGEAMFWDKAGYLERVASRAPFAGDPSFEIIDVEVEGSEIARVHLWVDVPPRRFEDHLGFARVGGEWKLITKVFRTMSGPEIGE